MSLYIWTRNGRKTDRPISSKYHLQKTDNLSIKGGSSYINSFVFVKYLGLILDNTPGMEKQVNFIRKSSYYQLENMGLIRKYINGETWTTLVEALIIVLLNCGKCFII